MKEFCYFCDKKHDDYNWRNIDIGGASRWICSLWFKPRKVDFSSQKVKNDRDKYAKSLIQPFREGEASSEFIEAYPERAKKMFTPKERLKAREVWKGDINPYWRKSK